MLRTMRADFKKYSWTLWLVIIAFVGGFIVTDAFRGKNRAEMGLIYIDDEPVIRAEDFQQQLMRRLQDHRVLPGDDGVSIGASIQNKVVNIRLLPFPQPGRPDVGKISQAYSRLFRAYPPEPTDFSPKAPGRVRGVSAAGSHHPGSLVASTSLYYSPSTPRIDL